MTVRGRAASIVESMWASESVVARAARGLLTPASWLFGAVVARRNRGYDLAEQPRPALAALSVGNLTVGGTGKTPISAWCVRQLTAKGARPAIVMRGYGDDEWRVHAQLNPGVPVIVAADRRDGLITARVRGADCAVLDDAFQHRRVTRSADIVLVSADGWRGDTRLLPAGPFREPLDAIRRAHAAVITVKAASRESIAALSQAIAAVAPDVPIAVIRLEPGTLQLAVTLPGDDPATHKLRVPASLTHRPSWLRGRRVCVVSAIGNPGAFEQQLLALGATLHKRMRYPDHHRFSGRDAVAVATLAEASDGVICTLKDAVKLAPLWPREAPPLWYVSQAVVVERGAEALDRAFARVLAARAGTAPTAG